MIGKSFFLLALPLVGEVSQDFLWVLVFVCYDKIFTKLTQDGFINSLRVQIICGARFELFEIDVFGPLQHNSNKLIL